MSLRNVLGRLMGQRAPSADPQVGELRRLLEAGDEARRNHQADLALQSYQEGLTLAQRSGARQVQEVGRYVPLDRVMLETDCPFLSPAPKRGVKPNEPAFLVHIAQKLAQLKGMTVEEIAQVTSENGRVFFQIDEKKEV